MIPNIIKILKKFKRDIEALNNLGILIKTRKNYNIVKKHHAWREEANQDRGVWFSHTHIPVLSGGRWRCGISSDFTWSVQVQVLRVPAQKL